MRAINNIEKDIPTFIDLIFEGIFQQVPFPIVILDLQGRIINCNSLVEKSFGYTKKDLLNKHYLDSGFYLERYASMLQQTFRMVCENINDVKPIEVPIYKRDGSRVWIISYIFKVNFHKSEYLFVVIIDVSKRKRNEQLLKHKLKTEKLISTISSRFVSDNAIDESIYLSLKDLGLFYKADRVYILLNSEEDNLEFFAQVSCENKGEIEKISLDSIIPSNYPWCVEEYVNKGYIHIDNVETLPMEAQITKERLMKLNIKSLIFFPLKIKEQVTGYIGIDSHKKSLRWYEDDFPLMKICSEIIGNALERRYSYETLRGSHQLLAGILASLTEIITIIDQNFDFIWVNNVAKSIFGQDITVKKCFEAFLNSHVPCEDCVASKCFNDGKIHEKELVSKKNRNESIIYWCTANIASLNVNNQADLVILILRDITERKHFEDLLLKDSNNSGTFLSEGSRKDSQVAFYSGEYGGALLRHNQVFNEILGLDSSENLMGSKASQFFVDDKTQDAYYNTLLTDGFIKNFVARIKKPDGKIITVQLNSRLIRDEKGNPEKVEGTFTLLDQSTKEPSFFPSP